MQYIVEIYNPTVCKVAIVETVEKAALIRQYGNIRFLAGPFGNEEAAREAVPQALSRKSLWDLTSPFYYAPPLEIAWVSSMDGGREKERQQEENYGGEDFNGFDF